MGNHVAGEAMGRMGQMLYERRRPEETAIDLLDQICMPYKNCDAEWEAGDPARPGHKHPDIDSYTDPDPKAGIGMLMVEAFAPNGLKDLPRYQPMFDADHPDHESATDAWFEEVYDKFKARYEFW